MGNKTPVIDWLAFLKSYMNKSEPQIKKGF